ncbi:hypothetical protein MMC28_011719 [Mycoblastus sanguinarius]|nr:hypothetical protein [Mycoblastus sanguinarius]
MTSGKGHSEHTKCGTRILQVDVSGVGDFVFHDSQQSFLGDWELMLAQDSPDAANLQEAASQLQNTDIPVAFPTETVYGLGADATRSSAVRGIYTAKQRPSDNPLIIHISSLSQLRKLLTPPGSFHLSIDNRRDTIPQIYHTLISRFWPGPLTILLPLPTPSPLAPEVTASLPTVAVRMPSSVLALALIHLAGVPLAAPSANASSKPSPTTAAHVLHDLAGRIDLILDGGACDVGVESTVVDGLSIPPVILRPGGISIEMLRECSGWEDVGVAYTDGAETGAPRAPGMKYKHYSPTARVLLFRGQLDSICARDYMRKGGSIGVLCTKSWAEDVLRPDMEISEDVVVPHVDDQANGINVGSHKLRESTNVGPTVGEAWQAPVAISIPSAQYSQANISDDPGQDLIDVWTIRLGPDITHVARGLFSALRELDQKAVDAIFVEGLDDGEGDTAAAIMNRLRKAAEVEIDLR